jgi:hypothetical protein
MRTVSVAAAGAGSGVVEQAEVTAIKARVTINDRGDAFMDNA